MKFGFVVSLLLGCCWAEAEPISSRNIKDFFEELHRDPRETITKPPYRYGSANIKPKDPLGSNKQFPRQLFDFGEIDKANDVRRFYPEGNFESDFKKLSAADLHSATLEVDIWSGDYWPTFKMGLARRYADADYPSSMEYNDYIEYFKNLGPIDFKDPGVIAKMSPAEKYDLLVLDPQMNMTNWSLWTSQSAFPQDGDEKGETQTWAGLCHGWAPAAFSVPRPIKAVTLDLGFTKVVFLPDDIKALATLLWSQTPTPNRFLGGRCNTKDPEKDEFGRISDPKCFDINPVAWHTILINQLSLRRRPIIIDATYDQEVWNQPLKSYQMVYFSLETLEVHSDAQAAVLPITQLSKDIFSGFRAKDTRFIVGVAVDVTYILETQASTTKENSKLADASKTVRYFYDIELDENMNMVGGEWYHLMHPDFVWTPKQGTQPETWFDTQLVGRWNASDSVPPRSWYHYAHAASKQGLPLAKIVEELVRRSREPSPSKR